MARAGKIRTDVKGGIISADCQPWIAAHGDTYDGSMMRDAAVDFEMEAIQDIMGRRVFGSTALGMKIGENVGLKTNVFLLKSLRERHRRWTQVQTYSTVQVSDRALMEEMD